jgi:hypothetical protein
MWASNTRSVASLAAEKEGLVSVRYSVAYNPCGSTSYLAETYWGRLRGSMESVVAEKRAGPNARNISPEREAQLIA